MKKTIRLIIVTILVLSIGAQNFITMPFSFGVAHANTNFLRWVKNDTLDLNLDLVQNKTDVDEVLLRMDMAANGLYTLEYFLKSGERTTLTFDKRLNQVTIGYKVEEGDEADHMNVTQSRLDASYLKMNYDLAVPTFEFIEDALVDPVSGALELTVTQSPGILYPGVAFEVDNVRLIIKWDFLTNQMFVLINDYEAGHIMPVSLRRPNNAEYHLNILKGIEDYSITPTHMVDDGGIDTNLGLVTQPGDVTALPGAKPGLRVTFKQPKTLDEDAWVYTYEDTDLTGLTAFMDFSNIGEYQYLDFNFDLNNNANTANKGIRELPGATGVNAGVVYQYNPITFTYQIDLVADKSELNNPNAYIEWAPLSASSIYNVNFNIQVENNFMGQNYEFTGYKPVNGFAYTYMSYRIRRANMSEAYLDIVPYNIGGIDRMQYDILYSKVKKDPLDREDDLWVQHFHDGTGAEGGNIYIPIPFSQDSSQDVYQVVVNFSGRNLMSQVLNYIARDDGNVPPTTPRIEGIHNLFVVPSDETDEGLSKVQFDLSWRAPDNREIRELDLIFADLDNISENDRIYYELMVNDVPQDTLSNPFRTVKIIEIYKEDGVIRMQSYEGTNDSGIPSTLPNYTFGYNANNQTFRLDGITIYDEGSWTNSIDVTADELTNTYEAEDSGIPYPFEYPGVNYLRLKATTMIDGKVGISFLSVPISLSLSLLDYDVPIVETLSYQPILGSDQQDPVGFDLRWQSVSADTYETNMLEPVDKEIITVDYDVYLSQSASAIQGINPLDNDYGVLTVNGMNQIVLDSENPDDYQTLMDLRRGAIKKFSVSTDKSLNAMLNTELIGLDQNTNYYVRIVTRLVIRDSELNLTEKLSEPSNMLSVTTPIIPKEPDDGEIKPLAVNNFRAEHLDENRIAARLSFELPDEVVFAENRFGFELLSLEDMALPPRLYSRDLLLEDIFNDAALTGNNREMWRLTMESGQPVLRKFNTQNNTFEIQPSSQVIIKNGTIQIIDDVNVPNKVYYYYIRTIDVENGAVLAASSWRFDTLTTAPIKAPINLRAVYDSGYTFDDQRQSIIRFDAPIPANANLSNDYRIEIHVRGEQDGDYSVTRYPVTYLGTGTGALGYGRFFYRITGLKPGSTYTVKVRIEDRTQEQDRLPDGTWVYPKSPFSESIMIRTEFDQLEYEKEFYYRKYLEHYDLKAKTLYQQPFYRLNLTNQNAIIKYRDGVVSGELVQKRNHTFPLHLDALSASQKSYTYYFPSSFFKTANQYQVTVLMTAAGQELGIRPQSIREDVVQALKSVLSDIRGYEAGMTDYYVSMTVRTGPFVGTIGGKTPSSDVMAISMGVHGATQKEIDLDSKMTEAMIALIQQHRELLKIKLRAELSKGIDESRLLNLVEQEVIAVEKAHHREADFIFNNALRSDYRSVPQLARNLHLYLQPYGQPLDEEAYTRRSGVWEKLATNFYNNRYLVESPDLASYILVPRDSRSERLIEHYSTETISMINRYNLSDLFTIQALTSNQSTVLKHQGISALARLLNAGVGMDTPVFLQNQGILLQTSGTYEALPNEEALYLFTQVFCKRHGIALNTVFIRDFNQIKNLNQVRSDYQNTVLKGANLGIFEVQNGEIQVKEPITVKRFMELLTRIDQGLY